LLEAGLGTTSANMTSLNMDLDILGEQPALFKLYTQLLFIFPISEHATQSSITTVITEGLKRLSEAFPWIAGQVTKTTSLNGDDIFKIVEFEPAPRLVIKDYTQDASIPTLIELRERDFPMSMLGEQTWAPCPTLTGLEFNPLKPLGPADEPAPVFLLQLSFVKEGVVLCVNAQHNVMDMTGQGHVIALLSKACRGEDFTNEEVEIGNMERKKLIPMLGDEWKPGPELDMQTIKHSSASENEEKKEPTAPAPDIVSLPPTQSTQPKCSWSYFMFSASSLATLKDVATKSLPEGTPYITTDDALSAFIFQCILRARQSRLSPSTTVKFSRAVDVRRYLNIPATYPGILQNLTYHSYSLSSLLSFPVGQIAAEMRRKVDPAQSSLAYDTRSLAAFVSKPGNKTKASFTAKMNLNSDIMLSSWSKIKGYEMDFGLGLGKPLAVRRPGFVPVESLLYLMPKALDEGIALAVCLREEDLEKLKTDEEFGKMARYIG
jgi:hypothetical protein